MMEKYSRFVIIVRFRLMRSLVSMSDSLRSELYFPSLGKNSRKKAESIISSSLLPLCLSSLKPKKMTYSFVYLSLSCSPGNGVSASEVAYMFTVTCLTAWMICMISS